MQMGSQRTIGDPQRALLDPIPGQQSLSAWYPSHHLAERCIAVGVVVLGYLGSVMCVWGWVSEWVGGSVCVRTQSLNSPLS